MEDWLTFIRQRCKDTTQTHVAKELGVSVAQVCGVLKGTYKGNLSNFKKRVESFYFKANVNCPVLKNIPKHACQEYQIQPFIATNSLRATLYHACRNCPQNERK